MSSSLYYSQAIKQFNHTRGQVQAFTQQCQKALISEYLASLAVHKLYWSEAVYACLYV